MDLQNVFVNPPLDEDQELDEEAKALSGSEDQDDQDDQDQEDVSSISQEEVQDPLPVVLTRYLYIKQDVLVSLLLSIVNKDWPQSLFWTCELYYSGFQEELVEFVWVIFRDCFQKYNPKLTKYIEKQYEQAMIDVQGANQQSYTTQTLLHIANMVRNMTVPTRRVDTKKIVGLEHYVMVVTNHDIMTKSVETRIYISVQESELEPHKTLEQRCDLKARHILKQACKYATNKSTPLLTHITRLHDPCEKENLVTMHRYCWLYYACQSPIWADRLRTHHGKLDDDVLCVVFDDLEDEEAFYEKYEYEPDEQSIAVQSMFMHL